jgi:hypothetical protein
MKKTRKNNTLEGCVYFFLPENNKNKLGNRRTVIYKMAKNDSYLKNELTNVLTIHTIPHFRDHFHVSENSSEVILANIELDKTDLLTKEESSILLKFEERGLIYLKNYLKALSSPRIYIFTIIESYKAYLKSIQLLVDRQIVHNYLNLHASLTVSKNEVPLITDFGFSLNIAEAKNVDYLRPFFIEYDPSYLEWSPEFHILSYLLTNKANCLSLTNIESILTEYLRKHSILKVFGQDLVSSFKEEGIKYFQKYVNQPQTYILEDILQHFGTWDNYALSISFLRILISVHRSIKNQNKFIIGFMKLLVQNISIDPCKRVSIQETTNKFNTLLSSLEPHDYKQLLSCLH